MICSTNRTSAFVSLGCSGVLPPHPPALLRMEGKGPEEAAQAGAPGLGPSMQGHLPAGATPRHPLQQHKGGLNPPAALLQHWGSPRHCHSPAAAALSSITTMPGLPPQHWPDTPSFSHGSGHVPSMCQEGLLAHPLFPGLQGAPGWVPMVPLAPSELCSSDEVEWLGQRMNDTGVGQS